MADGPSICRRCGCSGDCPLGVANAEPRLSPDPSKRYPTEPLAPAEVSCILYPSGICSACATQYERRDERERRSR